MEFNGVMGFPIIHINFPQLLIFRDGNYEKQRIFSSTHQGFSKNLLGDITNTLLK